MRRVDEVLAHYVPQAQVVTDCKSLYDALERSESLTLGLAEKRTSIEVQAIKQQMLATNMVTKWVNSDRQLADVLTKPQVPTTNCLTLQRTGRWKIVFDETFTSAKKRRKEARDGHFKYHVNYLHSVQTLPRRKRKTAPYVTELSSLPSSSHTLESNIERKTRRDTRPKRGARQ